MNSAKRMTKLIPALALVLATGVATTNVAQAADLLEQPVYAPPEVEVQSSKSGWYLRGDITYDFRESEGMYDNTFAEPYDSVELDDSWDLGIGVGYQVNDYFRADLTAEYVFSSDFTASNATGDQGVCNKEDALDTEECIYTDRGSVSTLKVLANAYADLGSFAGFTPYVGAGIGGAYVMYDDYTHNHLYYAAGDCPGCPVIGDDTDVNNAERKGEDSWRFAWALHAGASYQLKHNVALDFGYSYSRIEGGVSHIDTRRNQQITDDGFTDHVLRAGVRYSFW